MGESNGLVCLELLDFVLHGCGALPRCRVSSFAASYLCEGDPLSSERIRLGQEAIGTVVTPLPNSADGTVPGDGILLHWRGMSLQLPRTNNVGEPSYTDGRWWWRVKDPEHPEFRQRRGTIETYRCERQLFGASP